MNGRKLAWSFVFAFRGLVWTLHTQQNMRIHGVATFVAVGLLAWLRPPLWQTAWIVLSIFLVLAGEALNSALEAAVDRIGKEQHPLSGAAKDAAAGAVLLLALQALIAGMVVFGPPLWKVFEPLWFGLGL
ncbi:diacylglycerol kinase [Heliophilum fasciatum]|uniref:Diacylglycerol kinase (ATP) n=1 Tax=Heliophilum fasciatum TaxID=35700 RepID=A0A4R2RM37_9FIRM|nr:diacylglycerol kinase family protein [Heliophilum fasciatum]MCW2278143.1 diacylglycerol kinase (ATP) [Heliophilum fasciatum]TCP64213.1 diacylglycerol kinase (ATP) [Heliophilum fasciatum]